MDKYNATSLGGGNEWRKDIISQWEGSLRHKSKVKKD